MRSNVVSHDTFGQKEWANIRSNGIGKRNSTIATNQAPLKMASYEMKLEDQYQPVVQRRAGFHKSKKMSPIRENESPSKQIEKKKKEDAKIHNHICLDLMAKSNLNLNMKNLKTM